MVKMAFREKIKLFPNAPGCALSQKNTKKNYSSRSFSGHGGGSSPTVEESDEKEEEEAH